jgi:phytoene desaturase
MDSGGKKIAVIGAGLGGLAAGALLASRGGDVVIYERGERVGGKMGIYESGGYRWDTGPSLLTMPHVVDGLWEALGDKGGGPARRRLDVTCRYRWRDGRSIDEDEAFWRQAGVEAVVRDGAGVYALSERNFLNRPLGQAWQSLLDLGQIGRLRHFGKLARRDTVATRAARHVKDRQVRQIFERFATYNGSSPYRAPGAFSIIPYVQAEFGGWWVEGGMYRLAEGLASLAESHGATIRTGCGVEGVVEGRKRRYGLVLGGAEVEEVDVVVCNRDAVSAGLGFFCGGHGDRYRAWVEKQLGQRDMSLSGMVMMLGVRGRHEGLSHHNILFSDDYRAEFRQLFDEGKPADDPTIYVAVSAKSEPGRAPEGCENWFVLVNAPPAGGGFDWDREGEAYGGRVMGLLEERLGGGMEGGLAGRIEVKEMISPAEFGRRHGAHGGSLYGFASHGALSAFQRAPMRPPGLPGVWMVGGTTHPGGGIPLALLSGWMAAREIVPGIGAPPEVG